MKTILKSRSTLIVLPIACVMLFAIIYPLFEWYLPNSALTKVTTVLFINQHDLSVYFHRGVWAVDGTLPYRDYFAEYPPLAMLLFGLPLLLMRALSLPHYFVVYRTIFMVMMCGAFAWMLYLTRQLHAYISSTNRSVAVNAHDNTTTSVRPWAYLLLAPASIYFMYNRFDVLASAMVLASIVAFTKNNCRLAWIWMAIAFCMKWYALLLAPIYLSYYIHQQDVSKRQLCIAMALSVVAVVLIHVPVWLYGGIHSVAFPYTFHVDRGVNQESFLALIHAVVGKQVPLLRQLFLLLQFSVAGIALLFHIRTKQQAVYWSIAAIASFIFFAKFQSPQWVLWLSPLLVATMYRRSRLPLVLFILLEMLTYLYFPVLWTFARGSFPYSLAVQQLTIAAIGFYYARLVVTTPSVPDTPRVVNEPQ